MPGILTRQAASVKLLFCENGGNYGRISHTPKESIMIIRAAERRAVSRPKVWGGEGELAAKYSLGPDAAKDGENFTMAAEMTLAPGHSLGVHAHDDNEEIYVVLSGQGDYTDENGVVHHLSAGDTTLTRRGQSHGIANPGPEPLVFLAVIAR